MHYGEMPTIETYDSLTRLANPRLLHYILPIRVSQPDWGRGMRVAKIGI